MSSDTASKLNAASAGRIGHLFQTLNKLGIEFNFWPVTLYLTSWNRYIRDE